MFIVAVAAIGGLLDRLVLDRAQPLAAPRAAQATAAAEVSGASALYLQELSGVASGAQVRVEGAEWRTSDMVLRTGGRRRLYGRSGGQLQYRRRIGRAERRFRRRPRGAVGACALS